MADSWFSFQGSKELLELLSRLILFRREERARVRGEAMSAEGRGYQEILKAADTMTTVEQNRLRYVKEKAETMRSLGMDEKSIAIMVESEMAKLDRLGQALSVLHHHKEQGNIVNVRFEELPPAPDQEMR